MNWYAQNGPDIDSLKTQWNVMENCPNHHHGRRLTHPHQKQIDQDGKTKPCHIGFKARQWDKLQDTSQDSEGCKVSEKMSSWFVSEQQAKLLLLSKWTTKRIPNKIKDVAKEISMAKCIWLLLAAYNKIWKK